MEKGIVVLNKEFTADWLPILKENGINKIAFHALYKYGGLNGHIEWLLQAETQEKIKLFEENGITVEHEMHAVDWLLPRSLFNENPLWFRMNEKGERVSDFNFCVSNEDALKYVENSAFKLAFLLKQKSHRYYIWSDDGIGSLCNCEHCKKYNGADQNMIIMQSVLRGIKRYDPQAKLSFLSYQDSEGLPSIKPDKDMFLEFAPINRNHFSRIDGDDPENVKSRNDLEKLLKIFPASETQILEYFLDVSLYCKWQRENASALKIDKDVIENDVAYYAKSGVGSIVTFACFMDKEWRNKYGLKDIENYGKALKDY